MKNKRIFLVLLVTFLAINVLFTLNYLSTESEEQAVSITGSGGFTRYTVDHDDQTEDKVVVKLKVLDIYRLDISCDYIVDALSSQVSDRFKNTAKKCALASMRKEVNAEVEASYAPPAETMYEPVLDSSVVFDPFDLRLVNGTPKFAQLNELAPGGFWTPKTSGTDVQCAKDDAEFVVFIVPYTASRYDNLKLFLLNMHSYLQKLKRPFKYRIVVAEQVQGRQKSVLFNKGRVINTAVKYAMDTFDRIDCIVIHDVDILPIWDSRLTGDAADYRCNIMPVHLTKRALLMKTLKTRLYNQFLTGGILSLRPQHILVANGYSNEYFGWGGEDDDWTLRMFNKNLCIMRPKDQSLEETGAIDKLNKTHIMRRLNIEDPDLYRTYFLMLDHPPSRANNARFNSLKNALNSQMRDGISNIAGLTRITRQVHHRAFTHLEIQVA